MRWTRTQPASCRSKANSEYPARSTTAGNRRSTVTCVPGNIPSERNLRIFRGSVKLSIAALSPSPRSASVTSAAGCGAGHPGGGGPPFALLRPPKTARSRCTIPGSFTVSNPQWGQRTNPQVHSARHPSHAARASVWLNSSPQHKQFILTSTRFSRVSGSLRSPSLSPPTESPRWSRARISTRAPSSSRRIARCTEETT